LAFLIIFDKKKGCLLKVCDIYLPAGMDKAKLNQIWEVLDGPVMKIIQDNSEKLFKAVQIND
jgi:hypothetical protein